MESDIGFSLVRAFLIVFLITIKWFLLACKKRVIWIHSINEFDRLKYKCSWSLHAKEAEDDGKPCRLVDSEVDLNAEHPF